MQSRKICSIMAKTERFSSVRLNGSMKLAPLSNAAVDQIKAINIDERQFSSGRNYLSTKITEDNSTYIIRKAKPTHQIIEEQSSMPLKAKINNAGLRSRTHTPTRRNESNELSEGPAMSQGIVKELPDDSKEDVIFDTIFGLRTIELNRPEKYNSLDGSMIRKIIPRLQEWTKSDMANLIIIKGAGSQAFCAGGDVATIAKQNLLGEEGQRISSDFFALEYKLDHLIATYTKPFIALMDGYTMGGGVGLSIHAPIRIATERTTFAMPETSIGFFPDVGASFFLPRLCGALGTYLALTSSRLDGVNAFFTGVATHFIHSSSLYSMEKRLAELRFRDYDSLEERLDLINSTIEEFVTGLPHEQPITIYGERRKAIDRCFSKPTVNDIIAALKVEMSPNEQWAKDTLEAIQKRSPTSVYVAFRQMQIGKKWSILEAFQREHQMATRFMRKSDFNEGVQATLIRKDGKPKWDPASLEEIKPKSRIEEPYFDTRGIEPISFLANKDFKEYPNHKYGLPSEEQVETLVSSKYMNPSNVIEHFIKLTRGKQGVKEKVQDILDRNTVTLAKNGSLLWNEVTY